MPCDAVAAPEIDNLPGVGRQERGQGTIVGTIGENGMVSVSYQFLVGGGHVALSIAPTLIGVLLVGQPQPDDPGVTMREPALAADTSDEITTSFEVAVTHRADKDPGEPHRYAIIHWAQHGQVSRRIRC